MQDTRQKILDYLKTHNEATVEELRDWLGGITAVTVRHHLDVLRRDGLVDAPDVERRESPGRPRYIYTLTEKAEAFFPKNYRNLMDHLLQELGGRYSQRQVNVIFQGVAERIAADAPSIPANQSFEQRLKRVVKYLNEQGYVANYEAQEGGFLLRTSNCPYDRVEGSDEYLCGMDMQLISNLLGVVPRQASRITQGDADCSYFLPAP